MPRKAERSFRLYRYQISPTSKNIQGDFVKDVNSVEELQARKNDIFALVLNSIDEFRYKRAPITHQPHQFDSTFVIQLAANRPLKRTTRELIEEEIDNWPALVIVIDNRPNKQLVAIEMKQEAFRYTDTVIEMLETNINRELKQYQLNAQFEALFREEDFWRVIRRGKISYVKFYVVAPNMADLSETLSESLKQTIKRTNTNRAHLGFFSPPEESLQISRSDEDISGLVEYTSKGGGTIHVKIRGISATYKTNDETRTIQIDEIFFTDGFDPEQIGKMIRKALDDVQ